jgi:hypothetical protein
VTPEDVALLRQLAQEDEQFPGIVHDPESPPYCFFCNQEQENLNIYGPKHRADCVLMRARALLGVTK